MREECRLRVFENTVLRCMFENRVFRRMFENRVLRRMFENRVLRCMFENRVLRRMFESRVLRRMFENRVLRSIFGPKRDEVTGEWRKLHNEELNALYFLPNIVWVIKSRRIRWEGHVARVGEWRCIYGVLVGKHEGKRPLGGSRHRWEDNIKMDIQEGDVGVWTGSSWLTIGTGIGLL